jgi:hypothetical protein
MIFPAMELISIHTLMSAMSRTNYHACGSRGRAEYGYRATGDKSDILSRAMNVICGPA